MNTIVNNIIDILYDERAEYNSEFRKSSHIEGKP